MTQELSTQEVYEELGGDESPLRTRTFRGKVEVDFRVVLHPSYLLEKRMVHPGLSSQFDDDEEFLKVVIREYIRGTVPDTLELTLNQAGAKRVTVSPARVRLSGKRRDRTPPKTPPSTPEEVGAIVKG